MLIRDVMTRQAEWIGPESSLVEVARKMGDDGIGCLPVGTNDRMVGMITDRDLTCRVVAAGLDPKTAKAKQVMTKGVTWCFDDENIEGAMRRMEEKKIHHVPVINRQKRLVGILSLSDLALRAPQQLSGDISRLASRDARHEATAKPHASTVPMDPKELREKASHYMALTRLIDDARAIRALEDMAHEYNQEADDQERTPREPKLRTDDR